MVGEVIIKDVDKIDVDIGKRLILFEFVDNFVLIMLGDVLFLILFIEEDIYIVFIISEDDDVVLEVVFLIV